MPAHDHTSQRLHAVDELVTSRSHCIAIVWVVLRIIRSILLGLIACPTLAVAEDVPCGLADDTTEATARQIRSNLKGASAKSLFFNRQSMDRNSAPRPACRH